jgi:hypothetical protein
MAIDNATMLGWLDSLQAAYATGASEVTYTDGRTVRFRSAADLLDAIDRVSIMAGVTQVRSRTWLVGHHNGVSRPWGPAGWGVNGW